MRGAGSARRTVGSTGCNRLRGYRPQDNGFWDKHGYSVRDPWNAGAWHYHRYQQIQESKIQQRDLQGGRPLNAELTMEYYDCLLFSVTAHAGLRFVRSKQEFFNPGVRIDVDRAGYMAPMILVVKSAVNDVITGDLVFVGTVQEGIQLKWKALIMAHKVDHTI